MPAQLFDTHCHLTFGDLRPQCERVIADAVRAGVSRMITVAVRTDELEAALAVRKINSGVRVSAGIHPHEASGASEEDLGRLARFWREPGVAAAGEMGLDYHYDFSPREVQQSVFRRQLDLAAEVGLPVVVHCREAQEEAVRILLGHGYGGKPVVFHCFSGSAEEAAELRAHGWWTSFTGMITFKNAGPVRRACAETPADQLMFETDAPYLSPEPVRGIRPNEPQYLAHTVRFAAALRGQSFESLAEATTANAVRFFRLSDTRCPGCVTF